MVFKDLSLQCTAVALEVFWAVTIMLVFLNNEFWETGRAFVFRWKCCCVVGRVSSPKMVEMVERWAVYT